MRPGDYIVRLPHSSPAHPLLSFFTFVCFVLVALFAPRHSPPTRVLLVAHPAPVDPRSRRGPCVVVVGVGARSGHGETQRDLLSAPPLVSTNFLPPPTPPTSHLLLHSNNIPVCSPQELFAAAQAEHSRWVYRYVYCDNAGAPAGVASFTPMRGLPLPLRLPFQLNLSACTALFRAHVLCSLFSSFFRAWFQWEPRRLTKRAYVELEKGTS